MQMFYNMLSHEMQLLNLYTHFYRHFPNIAGPRKRNTIKYEQMVRIRKGCQATDRFLQPCRVTMVAFLCFNQASVEHNTLQCKHDA